MPTKPASASWYKAGKSSQQAHLVVKAGTRLLVTSCGVALNREQAVQATTATARCFECKEHSDE